jgi:glycosyltransferase involved in cell wall biosynthesis
MEIPNLVRLKDYRFRSRMHFRPRIFWMRAYHDIYDPRLAISVFERVCDYYDDAILTMAGPDMGLMDEIKDMAGKSKYAERIRVLPRVDFEEKQKLADDHDIYLNTNKIDNAPVSMVEMAAWGLALVSTKVGGIPYLFGQGTALLVDRDEAVVERLGEQVISIVKSPEQARAMVSQAYNQVSKFDDSLVKSQWLNII